MSQWRMADDRIKWLSGLSDMFSDAFIEYRICKSR